MIGSLKVGDLGHMKWGDDIIPFAVVRDQIDENRLNLMRISCAKELCWTRLDLGNDPEVVDVVGVAKNWYECFEWVHS